MKPYLAVFPTVDTLDSIGLRDDPLAHGAIVVPGPGSDAYLLSRPLTGDANSDDWRTVLSHFPREFSLTLSFRNDSASGTLLFLLSDGANTLIDVQLERTDVDQSDLVIGFPGVSVSREIPIGDNEFHSVVLKLEGQYLSIYVDCTLNSFLKLESTPENITVTDSTAFTLFGNGYVVRIMSLCADPHVTYLILKWHSFTR